MKKCILICLFGFALFYWGQPAKAQVASPTDSIDVPEKTIKLLYDTKPARFINGSVSHISGDEVANVPGVNRLNVLAGRMTGIYFYDVDGLPGVENSSVKIRGEHTFGANRSPLVLIDGRLDDYTLVDPYDIESVVFLKDAASLAMYGLRSTNGIILINTKRGQKGRAVVSVNSSMSLSQPTRLPKYLDSYNYAELYNEALYNDDPNSTPRYSQEQLDGYKYGDDPQLYPNVNWVDEFLKKHYWLSRTNLNISGGTDVAKYYVSGGYLYNSGVFNVDKDLNTYNTNTNAKVMNIHANVQLNIGKNLKVGADIRGKKEVRNQPGNYSTDTNIGNAMTNFLYYLPFNAHPIKNADAITIGDDGKEIDLSLAGTNDYQNNPYGLLNLRGYSVFERASISSYLNLAYDLSDLVKGLSIESRFGFNSYTDYSINRTKRFAVYQYLGNDADGNKMYEQFGTHEKEINATGDYRAIYRNYDHNIGLRYSGTFEQHHVDVLFMYDRQQVANVRTAEFTKNFQGPKGSISYRFNDKYLADFVFSYQGSEQYPKSDRYGFFPAVSAGWIISEESFMDNAGFIDYLKIRGSYGLTGNHVNTYFNYLETYGGGGGYMFGADPPANSTGYTQTRVANNAITWEKCLTTNAGLDFAILGNRLSGSFDYFIEKNKDILVQDAITEMYGAKGVYAPVGEFENKGFEIELKWTDRIGDVRYFIGANYYFAKNKIVFQDEQTRDHPWMYRTGHPQGSRFGYAFDRFFTDSEDISYLPNQSLLGAQQKPGDLKYKDLNDDGVIDDNDITRIGNSALPTANYGISFGLQAKGFDLNVLFHGIQGGTRYCSGITYFDFPDRTGNVMEHHLDRWQSGDEQKAGYPRLSLTNENNYVKYSSYWLKDNSFLRLKYVEIGYTLPVHISQKVGMSKARVFLNGNNLLVWDKMKVVDPELMDNGLAFPIQRTISLGLNVSF